MQQIEADENAIVRSVPKAFAVKLADGRKNRRVWKSYEELAETPEFTAWVDDEFPNRASLLNMDRRKFLTLGASALALAGLSGCRILPQTKAVPYVRAPEELIPGKAMVYASTLLRGGYGVGVLVESHEGRPTKIEGNPLHPASLGATDVYEQAEILNLYDPDRAQNVSNRGEVSSWDTFVDALRTALRTEARDGGAGLRVLTETITSPTLAAQMTALLARYPNARWIQYDPINRDNVHEGARLAFGRVLHPQYRLKGARVVLSLDADFMKAMPGNIRMARDFADGRRVRKTKNAMNRLYVIESQYSITGASADNRLAVKPSEVETVARQLQARLTGGGDAATGPLANGILDAIVADLQANRGAAVVIPGDDASPVVHALAHAMNEALGAVGTHVVYTAPVEANGANSQRAALARLVNDLGAGRVRTLVILGGNPVYNAPADLQDAFKNGVAKNVQTRIRLGMYDDETSEYCDWNIPEAHPLEAWSDARAFDGTASIVQPLINPLYEGRSAHEIVSELMDNPQPGYDIVKGTWQREYKNGGNFEKWWQTVLHNGVIPNTAFAPVAATVGGGALAGLPAAAPAQGLEIRFAPDPTLWDGRYANNSWLQELPKPITTVVWDTLAIISPATAKKLNIVPNHGKSDADNLGQTSGKKIVTVTYRGRKQSMPVWILPGQPDETVTVFLGGGRTRAGRVGNTEDGFDGFFNAYALRTSESQTFGAGALVAINVEAGNYPVSSTQAHHAMKGEAETTNRDVVRFAYVDEYREKAGRVGPQHEFEDYFAGGSESGASHDVPEGPKGGLSDGTDAAHGAREEVLKPEAGTSGGAEIERQAEAPGGENLARPADGGTIVADHGLSIPGLEGRKQWEYVDEDGTRKSYTNKEGYPSLYPEYSGRNFNAWALSIDLTTCIGCNACTIACQAENNIPTVGKDQVGRGREMHWIRIDHYYETDESDNANTVESHFMPVPCMHCEKAPCEPVCPVAATVHSHEGLNQMVYNRCVGTRYCSNNCPYKVRRYNFLKWTEGKGGPRTLDFFNLPVLKMLPNPDVTVRGRGVMEKCTYCVQRISAKRIEAKKEAREIKDGEIVMACQQVCPTNAIIFGDLNDPNARVTQLKNEPHDYGVLTELNTRPRTTYLARIKNPNPAIVALISSTGTARPAGAEG